MTIFKQFNTWLYAALVLPAVFTAAPLSAYPDGLGVAGPTQSTGSDAQAANFNSFAFTSMFPYVFSNYPSGQFAPPSSTTVPAATTLLSPGSLQLTQDSNVRVYFVGSADTLMNNSLGFEVNSDFTPNGDSLIFPNASQLPAAGTGGDPNAPYAGLAAGDFVDLGALSAGDLLDFFLLVNGANGTLETLWSDPTANPGAFNQVHAVQFDDTPYTLLAWEDGPFGNIDDDFDDLFVVLEIEPLPNPEPETYLIMGSFLAAVIVLRQKKKATGCCDNS